MRRLSSFLFLLFAIISPVVAGASSLPKERTFAIIKPNAVADRQIGAILERIERNGLELVALKMACLSQEQAEQFYSVHKERPFFKQLVAFMTSGPIVAMVLEGPEAVTRYRQLMGATDPQQALPGTLRAEFGRDVTANAVHGSDLLEAAQREISFFFGSDEAASCLDKEEKKG